MCNSSAVQVACQHSIVSNDYRGQPVIHDLTHHNQTEHFLLGILT